MSENSQWVDAVIRDPLLARIARQFGVHPAIVYAMNDGNCEWVDYETFLENKGVSTVIGEVPCRNKATGIRRNWSLHSALFFWSCDEHSRMFSGNRWSVLDRHVPKTYIYTSKKGD